MYLIKWTICRHRYQIQWQQIHIGNRNWENVKRKPKENGLA